jgi:DNA-binding MarR family transcriptional regulator
MKGMELLPFLTDEQRKLLETSELNYKRFARIYFKVLSYAENELVVKVWQMENPAEKYLSAKELVERAKGVFEGILPENTKLHVCQS